jgi:peptidyl-prolyl cis-trans isomerase C
MNRFVCALVAISALGCETEAPVPGTLNPTGEVLATVNGNPVTQGMFDVTLGQIPPQMREQLEQTGRIGQLKDQLVVGELLYREALKRGLHQKADVQASLAMAARSALADGLLDSIIEERSTAERVKKYYDDHAVQYAKEQAKVRVMVLASEEEATEVVGLVEGGGDFAKLATERSQDPRSKSNGGDLGWMDKSALRGEMAETVFGTEKGKLAGPIAVPGPPGAPQSAVLFFVEDKRDSIPLADVEEEIRNALQQEITTEYIEEIKGAATITEPGATGASVSVPEPGAAPAAPAAQEAPAAPAAPAEKPNDGHDH